MKHSHRPWAGTSLVCALVIWVPSLLNADTGDSTDLPRPNPSLFQSGDFVWPKKPGVYVPYNAGSTNSPDLDRERWNRERDAYLKKNKDSATADKVLQQRLETLRTMDFREFIATYAGGQE